MDKDTQAASSPDVLGRYLEELLSQALDVMGQLQENVPVTPGWMTVRNTLQEEAKAVVEPAKTETQQLLQKALNLMGQAKANAAVSTSWITEREGLRQQALALFAPVEK